MKSNNKKKDVNNKKFLDEKKPSFTDLLGGSFLYNFKEFFNVSTLHGVRYIAETERPLKER